MEKSNIPRLELETFAKVNFLNVELYPFNAQYFSIKDRKHHPVKDYISPKPQTNLPPRTWFRNKHPKPFGINVTIIEPGYVRTNFLNNGSIALPKQPIADYVQIAEEKRKHQEDVPGTQAGDPQKVAEVIISTSKLSEPPLRLLLGSDALQFANYKIQMLQTGIEANKETTLSTDFK